MPLNNPSVGAVPVGGIIIWSGLIVNIPAGWRICDGNNGTPNLLARFLQGVATAATNPGAIGGAVNHTHPVTSGFDDGGSTNIALRSIAAADGRPPFYDVAFIQRIS